MMAVVNFTMDQVAESWRWGYYGIVVDGLRREEEMEVMRVSCYSDDY